MTQGHKLTAHIDKMWHCLALVCLHSGFVFAVLGISYTWELNVFQMSVVTDVFYVEFCASIVCQVLHHGDWIPLGGTI